MSAWLSRRAFDRAVREAVRGLPEEFLARLGSVTVEVREWPTEEDYRRLPADDRREGDLFGLFVGRPLTEQEWGLPEPCQVLVFRRPLLAACRTEPELRLEIQNTVVHEVAHFFGYAEADLEGFEAAQAEAAARLRGEPVPPPVSAESGRRGG